MDKGSSASIVIVDYGMGNLRNVQKAFEHIGVMPRVSSQAADLVEADGLVLPGVGAFGDAMANLRELGLDVLLRGLVSDGKPLLGICLGLQLLFQESEEMGVHRGLGVLPGKVVRFAEGLKVPHIGWNQLQLSENGKQSVLLDGIPDGSYAYFVHSYYVAPEDPACALATTDYGLDFVSVVGQGRVFGAQPHPEKSQEVGLRILRNFAQMIGAMA
jgi:glutamine amidotransferase